jgi:hypothetical protein
MPHPPEYTPRVSLLAQALTLVVIWIIGAALLGWGRLPAAWRWRFAVLASASGVAFLVLGMSTEGLRQAPTLAVVLLGTPYVTGQVSASASLPYYLATAVCLLLGSLGLGFGDELADLLRRRWLLAAIVLSLLVTVLRFLLEKVAAPPAWSRAMGIVWLAPVVGAYFALSLKDRRRPVADVARALTIYAFVVRAAVAVLVVAATTLRAGSHYDVSPLVRVRLPLLGPLELEAGSLGQVLILGVVPQLVVWPVYTIVAGLLGASVVRPLLRRRTLVPAPVPMPASADGSGAL